MKYNKENLYIAGVRYFDKKHNGIELEDNISYVILSREKKDNEVIYHNVFDISENYPVYKRSRCYSNCTNTGEEYGTKIIHESGKIDNGPCWLLEEKLGDYFEDDEIDTQVLEDLVLKSDKYFKDRSKIALKRFKKNPIKTFKILIKDKSHEEDMDYFLMKNVEKMKKIR